MVFITLISSLVSWYSAFFLSRAGRKIFLVPIAAILGIFLGVLSGVGAVFLLIYAMPALFTAKDILEGGIRYSAFSLFLGPYAAYRGYKQGKVKNIKKSIGGDDPQPEGQTLSSGRKQLRQYSSYAAPKRSVFVIWMILSIILIFSTFKGSIQLSFWGDFVQHKMTGERVYSESFLTEVEGQYLSVPRSGLTPGTPGFAKARKLFPSFHDKPDAEFREHLEELANTRMKAELPGSVERNIARTAKTIGAVFLLLIFVQLAYFTIVWSAKKFPPTPYGKKCTAIAASWVIASFTWALLDLGEDTFSDYDFFYERIIIYPPIAFALMALLWAWANKNSTNLKP